MLYKLTFEDGSNGYLAHHGVKGMKWGVWNDETRARRLGSANNAKIKAKDNKKSDVLTFGPNKISASEYKYHKSLADKTVKKVVNDPSVKTEAAKYMKQYFVAGNMVDDKEYVEFVAHWLVHDIIDEKVRFSSNGIKINEFEDVLDGHEIITPTLHNYEKTIDAVSNEVYKDFMKTKA